MSENRRGGDFLTHTVAFVPSYCMSLTDKSIVSVKDTLTAPNAFS